MGRGAQLAALLALSLLALAGCGGGGGGKDASSATQEASPSPQKSETAKTKPKAHSQQPPQQAKAKGAPEPSAGPPASSFQPKPHRDPGGGSKQFVSPGADNSVQEYGAEASQAEFEAAARAFHDLLDARAQQNWAAACEYLSKAASRGLAELASRVPELKGKGCPTQLDAVSGSIAASKLREAAIASVASVRVQGQHGFLIYRGAHGQVEAVTMAREGSGWKVASLGAAPLG